MQGLTCLVLDDSFMNCKKAQELGWTAVHLLEPEDPEPPEKACKYQIRSLQELPKLFPDLFKTDPERGL